MTEPAQLSLSYEELVGFALGALEGVSQNFDEATRLRLIHLMSKRRGIFRLGGVTRMVCPS